MKKTQRIILFEQNIKLGGNQKPVNNDATRPVVLIIAIIHNNK